MTTTARNRQTDKIVDLFHGSERILVMGVLNVTLDSFSDGGRYFELSGAIDRCLEMADEGADIIDIGGESTRPGAQPVAVDEELRRVLPLIEEVAGKVEIPISIDTCKSTVAEKSLRAGAIIVNDISGLTGDLRMAEVVARFDAGLVVMHRRGTPQTMQLNTEYLDLIGEIKSFLADAVTRAESAGVDPGKIMIDPGIGFGKDLSGNLKIIQSLDQFQSAGKPILVGASRKSFIGLVSGLSVDKRLYGSIASAVAAVLYGASAVRVHDVKETRQAVDLAIKFRRN